MHAESFIRLSRKLTFIILALVLVGCGEGDGQTRILGTAATPVPPAPPGQSCDFINFEDFCPPALESIVEFEGGPISITGNPQVDANNDSATVGQMQKFAAASGLTFGGSTMNLNTPFNVVAGSSFTMKVWSSRPVNVLFQPEPAGPGTGVEETHGGTGWEVLTFDFGGLAGTISGITLIFDNGILGNAGADPDNWTFYFDDITLVPPGGATGPSPIDPDVALYLTDGDPDLVAGVDYAEITPFGSGSVIDAFYSEDEAYIPVLSVFSGTGYGANIAQVAYIGFAEGFAGAYETLNFKVKGMPNFVIFVKLFDGVDTLRINLTSSAFSEALTDGWYQVSIPLSSFVGVDQATGIVFESDDSAPMQFTMLLTDIGFSGTGTGGPVDPFDSGLLTNGDFEAGVDPWIGNAANVVDDGGNNVNSAEVATAGNPFDVNLSQVLTITQGETYTLTFKARSDGMRTILAGIGLNEAPFSNVTATANLTAAWQTFEFEFTATDFGNANSRVLFDMGADTGLVLIDDVSLVVSTAGGGGVAGNIAINGDFETGDFSGWETSAGSEIQLITTDNPSSGTYAANLNVPVRTQTDPAVDNLIKNANLQAGNLTPGDTVTVSFDMRGSLSGAGGVVFVELFSELSGGGTSKAEILSGGPLTPVTAWTNYSFTTTLGTDVSGGVTLQLKASCGPVEGCGVDVFFDNVSIVTGGGGGGGGGTGGTGSCGGAGELAINCDFETGDFGGWETFPGGGIQVITTDNPSSGTYAANLNVPVRTQTDPAVDNLIKNANLGAGNLTPGASVTVSFDMRGSLSGAGGVVFAEFFSELSGGGTSKAEIFTGGPLTPDTAWVNYTFTTTLGPDVSGGVTLQLKTSCGPVEGCGVDAYFDNVSIVVN